MIRKQKIALVRRGICRHQQKLIEVEVTPRQLKLLEKGKVKQVLKEPKLK